MQHTRGLAFPVAWVAALLAAGAVSAAMSATTWAADGDEDCPAVFRAAKSGGRKLAGKAPAADRASLIGSITYATYFPAASIDAQTARAVAASPEIVSDFVRTVGNDGQEKFARNVLPRFGQEPGVLLATLEQARTEPSVAAIRLLAESSLKAEGLSEEKRLGLELVKRAIASHPDREARAAFVKQAREAFAAKDSAGIRRLLTGSP